MKKGYYSHAEYIIVKEDRDSLRRENEELKIKVLELNNLLESQGSTSELAKPSIDFKEFLSYLCDYYNTSMSDISRRTNVPHLKKVRDIICYIGRVRFRLDRGTIAKIINRDEWTVANGVRLARQRAVIYNDLKAELNNHIKWINEYK